MIDETVSHYRILKKLGGGGMGVVYEAEDLSLKRHVALKFLPEDLAKSQEALERFRREAQSASALNHPNICTIYEIGEYKGSPFIAMELMKGKTLKYAINGNPMEIDQVLDLGSQIADALAVAHRETIIHRDIKPANVFVTERGQAKLLDFGLAKRIESSASVDTEQPTQSAQQALTKSGAAMGTVAYMSPEQARGKELDARTDIFSFGVLLYEMTTGKLPFGGQTTGGMLEAIFTQDPTAPVRLNPKVPAKLEEIIAKALEKDRSLRYQSAAEMSTDLQRLKRDASAFHRASSARTSEAHAPFRKWTGAAAIIVVLLAAGVFYFTRESKTPESKVPVPTSDSGETAIAVLPFTNMSSDKDQEYFSDGLTEELTNALTKNPKLRVTSRTSAFSFKGKEVDVKVIAEKLRVTHVLEGSVRKAGNQLRITAQLIEVANDSHIWSQTYDRQLENIFAIQNDIAASVADALKVTFGGGQTFKAKLTNPEAYNAFLQGQYLWDRRGKEDLEKAIEYYQQALRIEPNYARPWVGLAAVHATQADDGYLSMEEGYAMARKEVEKALELDPDLAEAYAIRAAVKRNFDWDWSGADSDYQRAMQLDPGNIDALRGAAYLAGTLGHFEEAITIVQRAIELDPLGSRARYNLGGYANALGRLDLAEEAFRKTLELNPLYPAAHVSLARIYLGQSRLKDAVTEIQKEPLLFWRQYGQALVFYAEGKKKESDSILHELTEAHQNDSAFQIAQIYAYRGETNKAFDWLDRALKQRDAGLTRLKGDQLLRSLERDPRYNPFLQKMKLPLD